MNIEELRYHVDLIGGHRDAVPLTQRMVHEGAGLAADYVTLVADGYRGAKRELLE